MILQRVSNNEQNDGLFQHHQSFYLPQSSRIACAAVLAARVSPSVTLRFAVDNIRVYVYTDAGLEKMNDP